MERQKEDDSLSKHFREETDYRQRFKADSNFRTEKIYIKKLHETYNEVRKEFMIGRLDDKFYGHYLLTLDKSLLLFEKKSSEEERHAHRLLRIQAKCLLIDSLYWIGRTEEAKKHLTTLSYIKEDILHKADSLSKGEFQVEGDPLADDPRIERVLLREKIRITINYTLIFHYHEHKYGDAEKYLRSCLALIDAIQTSDLPCFGTKAICYFYLARTMRNLHKWAESEEFFRNAIQQHAKRVKYKKESFEMLSRYSHEEFNQELAFSRYRTAIFLALGRGWLNYQRGQLEISLYYNIIPARVSLEETSDFVNKGYLQMLEGCVRRELYAAEETELHDALALIREAKQDFIRMKHRRYIELAEYEETHTSLYLIRLWKKQGRREKAQISYCNKALDTIKRLRTAAENRDDVRWQSQYLILESKLVRIQKEYVKAESLASEAIRCLQNNEDRDKIYRIESLIAWSAALIDLGRYAEAIEHLSEALSLNKDTRNEYLPINPKLEAIIHFIRARAHSMKNEIQEAKRCIEQGNKFLPNIENAVVQELKKEVEQEIEDIANEGFVIDSSNLDLKQNIEKLKAHLIQTALKFANENVSRAAELLNVNQSSVFRNLKGKATRRKET